MGTVAPYAATMAPHDVAGVSAVLERADSSGQHVTIRGSWTWRARSGTVASADIVLSTTNLNQAIAHRAGDLVAIIPAGWTLDDANRVLGRGGQQLPLDPPFSSRATIGGIVAV